MLFMTHIPQPQEIYRHFKGNLYQIITVAEHSETGERLVIYQALYGDFKIFARELGMFTGRVDRSKYPNCVQEYRFELVEGRSKADQRVQGSVAEKAAELPLDSILKDLAESAASSGAKDSAVHGAKDSAVHGAKDRAAHEAKDSAGREAKDNAGREVKDGAVHETKESAGHETKESAEHEARESVESVQRTGEEDAEQATLDPMLLEFLDAKTYEARLNILAGLHHRITQDMITTMAVSCDIEVGDGEVEERYQQLKNCLLTLEKYECNRLR